MRGCFNRSISVPVMFNGGCSRETPWQLPCTIPLFNPSFVLSDSLGNEYESASAQFGKDLQDPFIAQMLKDLAYQHKLRERCTSATFQK